MTDPDVIVRGYANLVWKVARRYYAHGHDVDDLAQEGFIGLLQAVRDFRPDQGSFPSFATMCVERRVQDVVKRSQRGKHRILTDAARYGRDEDGTELPVLAIVPDRRPGPVELAEQHDTIAAVVRGLPELTPLERRCLVRLAAGDSYEEIGGSAKSIDNAVQRARRKLREAA